VVPVANLVGHEGHAVLHMMRNLELERLTLAAMSLGIARRSIEIMNRYARERAFGKPLDHFGQIQRTSPRATPSTWRGALRLQHRRAWT
jgi:isovaleryl-CoA dehydrogenase